MQTHCINTACGIETCLNITALFMSHNVMKLWELDYCWDSADFVQSVN
jgi:hypothetical protein